MAAKRPRAASLKPKFGDIDEAFYTDLPAQRQQCLEAINRKIALCRDNTLFESNTKNEKYAGCLPIFREQAEVCVKHFERERGKCGAGTPPPAEAATLDASERQRVQAALAAEGFDPGPADGKFGPRTRQAIAAWQQANGHAATGALTEDQAESLLAGVTPLEPFGPNWIIAENQLCQLYNRKPEPGETMAWSGGCVDGKASGEGRAVWRNSHGEHVYNGGYRDGKRHGRGAHVTADGGRLEGEWRDGVPHGHAILTWASGSRYEGEFREWKPHGRGTYTYADGSRYKGKWRDGCFEENGQQAWVLTTKVACGFE